MPCCKSISVILQYLTLVVRSCFLKHLVYTALLQRFLGHVSLVLTKDDQHLPSSMSCTA